MESCPGHGPRSRRSAGDSEKDRGWTSRPYNRQRDATPVGRKRRRRLRATSALMKWARAPAKINLSLRVIGRRADGYHELESLVAFAGLCDWVGFEPGRDLVLEVLGPRAVEAGPLDENL